MQHAMILFGSDFEWNTLYVGYGDTSTVKINFVILWVINLFNLYVCIRGGLLQPLHLDPQWSIVLNPYDK
jgi:hypothetical protein